MLLVLCVVGRFFRLMMEKVLYTVLYVEMGPNGFFCYGKVLFGSLLVDFIH